MPPKSAKRYRPKARKSKKIPSSALTKKVIALTHKVNRNTPELLWYNRTFVENPIGQMSANAASVDSGHFGQDITPTAPVAIRKGDKARFYSMTYRMQFYGQNALQCPINGRIEIWKVKGTPTTPAALIKNLYEYNEVYANANTGANPFVYDTFSYRDLDQKPWASKVFVKKFKVKTPTLYDSTPLATGGQTNCRPITDVKVVMNWKDGYEVNYDPGSNTPVDSQLIMFIFCDTGNSSSLNVPATYQNGCAQTASFTGMLLNSTGRYTFQDA